jgi:hypothetical protein
VNRRQFVKAGAVGAALLAAGGAWVVWRDVRDTAVASPARDRLALVIGAVAPVLLAGALPDDAPQRADGIQRVIEGVRSIIAGFPPAVQGELADLFRLLDIGAARRWLAGLPSDWPDADPRDVSAFLERWRKSRMGLLQSAYFALHDLVYGAWYADPATWPAIGYPGPPEVA